MKVLGTAGRQNLSTCHAFLCDIESANIVILALFQSEWRRKWQPIYLLKAVISKKFQTAKCYARFHLLNEELLIAPDKDLSTLGKYPPLFGELGISIFNWVSQFTTVIFNWVFQNFQLGIHQIINKYYNNYIC